MNRLVPEAEAADHHPDVLINYKRVTLIFDAQRRRAHREGLCRGGDGGSSQCSELEIWRLGGDLVI